MIQQQMKLIEEHRLEIENLARDGYLDYGRGLVLVAGAHSLGGWTLVYVPTADATLMCDAHQCHALFTYVPETHFLILFGDLVLDLSPLYSCRVSNSARRSARKLDQYRFSATRKVGSAGKQVLGNRRLSRKYNSRFTVACGSMSDTAQVNRPIALTSESSVASKQKE